MSEPEASRRPESGGLPQRRVTGNEREAVVRRLSDAFADDALPMEELEQRIELAYKAQTTTDLARLTDDLPAPADRAASVAKRPGVPVAINAVFSSFEKTVHTGVPAKVEIHAVFGNVELDLREAEFQEGTTVITAISVFGNVEIQLPEDVIVDSDGTGIFGNFECHPKSLPGGGRRPTRHVRITGNAIFGNVEVNNKDRAGKGWFS